jgi:hypothetical protein
MSRTLSASDFSRMSSIITIVVVVIIVMTTTIAYSAVFAPESGSSATSGISIGDGGV